MVHLALAPVRGNVRLKGGEKERVFSSCISLIIFTASLHTAVPLFKCLEQAIGALFTEFTFKNAGS